MSCPPKTTLLSAIALLVVALAVLVFLIFRDGYDKNTKLAAKQPSRYGEGMYHRTAVTSDIQGHIEDKDPGVEKKVTPIHEGETEFKIRETKALVTLPVQFHNNSIRPLDTTELKIEVPGDGILTAGAFLDGLQFQPGETAKLL